MTAIKGINNSVFIAEPEQQVVHKVWGHKISDEYKAKYWLVKQEPFAIFSEFLI